MDCFWPTLSEASSEDTRKAEVNIIWRLLTCMPDTNGYQLLLELGWSTRWLNAASPCGLIFLKIWWLGSKHEGLQRERARWQFYHLLCPGLTCQTASLLLHSVCQVVAEADLPQGVKIRLSVLKEEKCQGSEILGLETWLWTFLENKVGHGDFFFSLIFSFLYVSSLLSNSF